MKVNVNINDIFQISSMALLVIIFIGNLLFGNLFKPER